ncbi:hypothetical protein [Microbacterium sp.]|uniref:hypothetical protein n=1 Tax=Microbacterium sp. TaxID=51671 RepID=UPI003C713B5F
MEQATPTIAPLLYDEENARHMLGGIGRSKLFEEIAAGRLRAVKIGRRTFIAHAELERYVAGLYA